MKKSIRIAAALCAAVFALPVLAGCDNGGLTDETVDGNGSNSSASGNTGNTGNSGNGGTSGGNSGTSQGGTGGGDTGNTGNTGDTGDSGTSGGNSGTSQGGTGDGGDTGDTGDSGDSGNGDTSGGNTGNVAQNLFKGKTIEYTHDRHDDDGSWYERKISITFATDTTGTFASEYRGQDSDSEQIEESKGVSDIVYSLESVNGKNLLYIAMVDVADAEFDKFFNEYYQGISAETKELLRKEQTSVYYYYEFMDDNTVRMITDYYVGDMAKCGSYFHGDENTSDSGSGVSTNLSFSSYSLSFYYDKREYNETDNMWNYTTRKRYWGIPQFNNNDFTVSMYRVDRTENGDEMGETYVGIGSLVGTYAIEGTGGNCDGTITFTQFPDEMKDLFALSYQIKNYDLQDDDWDEFRIVTE